MAKDHYTGLETLFFSLLITFIFFLSIEVSARIFLSIKKGNPSLMLYGFVKHRRLQSFVGSDGVKYYKSTPLKNRRNPVNNLGFRGPEIKTKQSGTCRVVCLGGSTTHGAREDYEDIYPTILQRNLDKSFGVGKYETINAGQPGLCLEQINSLVRDNVLRLVPDIVLILSINNNLFAPGFWYVGHADPDNKTGQSEPEIRKKRYFITRLRNFIVRNIATASLLDEFVQKNISQEPWVDWERFADALLSDENIWEAEYNKQLDILLHMLFKCNPDMQIVLLGQAINTKEYPMMGLPFEKAKEILYNKAKEHSRVSYLDTHSEIIKAASRVPVWQHPALDPLHLNPAGNEILAQHICDYFLKSSHLQQCNN